MMSKTVMTNHRKIVKTACPAPLVGWALGASQIRARTAKGRPP
jgi:hypothetical protein